MVELLNGEMAAVRKKRGFIGNAALPFASKIKTACRGANARGRPQDRGEARFWVRRYTARSIRQELPTASSFSFLVGMRGR